jgi:ABC-type nitrate/sulfonate/bicarbonate transport system substrate-binding protein
MLGSGVGVMGSSLAQHPNFGERLFRAMTKTYAWMKDPTNQQEMVKIATGTQGLPQTADLGSRLKVLAGQMTASNDRALLQRTLDFLYDTRQVKPEPRVTVDQFFDQVMVSGT